MPTSPICLSKTVINAERADVKSIVSNKLQKEKEDIALEAITSVVSSRKM